MSKVPSLAELAIRSTKYKSTGYGEIDRYIWEGQQPGSYRSYKRYYDFQRVIDCYGDVPKGVQEAFISGKTFGDIITENLQTHSFMDLCNKLKEIFPEITKYWTVGEKEHFNFHFFGDGRRACYLVISGGTKEYPFTQRVQRVKSDPRFKDIVAFYGYRVSSEREYGNSYVFTLEPNLTRSATEYIQEVCKLQVFHTCPKEIIRTNRNKESHIVDTAESILKNGLRCRTGVEKDQRYRDFPKRI